MSDILGVVSYDTVRALLGLTLEDVDDTALSSFLVEQDVTLDLLKWFPDYTTVLDSSYPDQSKLALLELSLNAYIKYYSAWIVSFALEGMMLKKLTDGENEGQRSDKINYQQIRDNLRIKAELLKKDISEAVAPDISVSQLSLFSVVTPSYDPVTNQ